jgi:hypothetical protein
METLRSRAALLATCAVTAWAQPQDATNGLLGEGSYIGSDEWLGSFARSILEEVAGGEGREGKERLQPRLALGASLLAERRPAEAAAELGKAVSEQPGNVTARLLYGAALLSMGDPGAAERELERCPPGAHGGLAQLFRAIALDRQGKGAAALAAYDAYLHALRLGEVERRARELRAQLGAGTAAAPRNDTAALSGSWRVFSSRLFYDRGGAGALGARSYTLLELSEDGSWRYGPSAGSWSVGKATERDWKAWGVEPYGPTRKLILEGWSGTRASGPIEETDGRIDFLWVIYRVEPPRASAPGTVHMKLGAAPQK